MALVAYTIVSRYTPQQRESITETVVPEDDPWQTESSFGATQRLSSRAAPNFVPPSLEYDEYGMPKSEGQIRSQTSKRSEAAEEVGTWYRSLTSSSRSRRETDKLGPPSSSTEALSPRLLPRAASVAHPPPEGAQPTSRQKTTNWFTTRSQPPDTSIPTRTQQTSKPSAFADLLSRNPPPLPSEPAFKPPVFLALGPGNKGFAMLQRKGWREGEGLGSARVERVQRARLGVRRKAINHRQWKLEEDIKPVLQQSTHRGTASFIGDGRQEVIDLTHSDSETPKEHEVVDLTLSDSQSESDTEPEDADQPSDTPEYQDASPHGTMLITPLPTTLKADRLGIGLKARRRPAAKAKAVTHTSSALAAHIRSANKMRKDKVVYGRGSRGFARSKKREERERVGMLAYMNS